MDEYPEFVYLFYMMKQLCLPLGAFVLLILGIVVPLLARDGKVKMAHLILGFVIALLALVLVTADISW